MSYDLRVWSVPKEPNLLAIEVRSRRIGAVPLAAQTVLAELTELATRYNSWSQLRGSEKTEGAKQSVANDVMPRNIELTPYRYEANPVALIRFQSDQGRPSQQLKCLHLSSGELRVGGSCGMNSHPAAPGELPPAAN